MININLENVEKKLKNKYILNNISYSFQEGRIYGLYGNNGSGKTMLLRTISGLLRPSSGLVQVDGIDIYKSNIFPSSLGVIIENTSLLPQYSAYTNLKILSKIKRVATDNDIKNAIKRVGLDPDNPLKVKKYSLGMKQRLSIAQAILERPNILLLDEPTNAIDEDGVKGIYQILEEEKQRGAIIIIASHHLQDLENLADECIQMKSGAIINVD